MSKRHNKQPQPGAQTTETKEETKVVEPTVEVTAETQAAPVVDESAKTGGDTGSVEGEGSDDAAATSGSMAPAFQAEGIEEAEVVAPVETVVLSPMGQTIAKFAEVMLPTRAISPKQVATQQMEMYHAVEMVLAKKGADFFAAWKEMLGIVAEHPVVFTDANMFRGFRDIRLAPAKRERYINLMILIMSTADPARRNIALKAINMAELLKDYPAEVGQNIQGFYQKR